MTRHLLERTSLALAMLLASVASSRALAQGTISMQGFGYPLGGLSTRASGTAGALAEFDLLTPQNPASLTGLGRAALAVQAEPEYRTLRLDNVKESTNAQRLPLVLVALRLTSRAVVSLSGAGFLDRSYSTSSTGQATVEGQQVNTADITSVKGAITDLRAGLGWQLNARLSVGIAGHVFTGSNRLDLSRKFADTLSFGTVLDTSSVDYFGRAASFGAQLQLPKGLTASGSYRQGGRIEAESRKTVLRRATVPNRLAGGLLYAGIPGSSFAFNVEHVNWTALESLGSAAVQAHDATNWSLGAELSTGRVRSTPVLLRVGTAHQTLPFGIANGIVTEQRFGGGVAVALTSPGRDQATLDFSLQRANRRMTGSAAREGAWLLGFGVQIRP